MKFLVTGLILYFLYRVMFRPSLKEGKTVHKEKEEGEIEIRREGKNPREDRGEFIDYEEVE